MAGPIDPRTLAIIQAMEPAAAERQAIMARDAVMRGPAPAPMNPVFRPGQDAAPVMPAGLRIAPAPPMGMDQFADVRNPIPQPRGPMTAPQPSADMLVPPDTPNVALQPMRPYMGSNTFNVPIGPKPDRFAGDWRPGIPGFEKETRALEGVIGTPEERLKAEFSRRMQGPPKPPAGNMLAPDVEETGSVAPAPAAPAPGNRLEAPMPAPAPAAPAPGNQLEAPMPTGRRVYDPAAGTNQPRFIYEGGPAPMRASGGGSAIATGGGAVPATGGAGGAAMPYSGGGEGGGMGDGFFDFLGGFSRGGLLGGIQGIQLGKQARAKAGLSAQQENMTRQVAKRLGVPDDVANSLDGKSLASLVIDIQKQNMTPKEAKAPDLQTYYDDEGRERKGYMRPDGTMVPVGGAKAGDVAGKSRPLVTPEERAAYGIPEDDRAVYQVDANNEVKRIGDGALVKMSIADEVAQRKEIAEQNGLKPGTKEYQSYVFDGQLPGDQRATATELKEKWSSEDELGALAQQEKMLREALTLVDGMYSGAGAGVLGTIGEMGGANVGLFDKDKVDATQRYKQIMTQQAIEAMSNTLKGASTDFEMNKFLEIIADPSASADRKKEALNSLLGFVETKRGILSRRVGELGGTDPSAPQGGGADMVFNPATGKLEPAR